MAPHESPSIVNCQKPVRRFSTLKLMSAARHAYWSTHSWIIRRRAPRAGYLKRNRVRALQSRTRFAAGLLDLEDPDQIGGELTGGAPLVVARHPLAVVVLHEVEQRRACDGARVDALHQDGARVVTLSAVGARLGVELLLVLLGERSCGRAARAGQDRILGGFTGLADELRVLRTVGADEGAFEAAVLELLDERSRLRVVAAVEHGFGVDPLDLSHRGGEVLVALLHRDVAAGIGRRTEGVAYGGRQAEPVVGAVVDDADLLVLETGLHVVRDRRALNGVVGQASEERPPTVLAERGVRRRSGHRDQTGLIEDAAGGLRLTRECRA